MNYWKLVNKVIREADILLLVLDSRFPDLTRNKEIEDKIKREGKKILYVLNKCDLIEINKIKNCQRLNPRVYVSSTKRYGGTILYRKILEIAKGKQCVVGVLGYPNVGKSSVINLLKGEKVASVSPVAGHTKGIQFVRKGKIKLIDTPGVFPYDEKNQNDILKQVIIGSKNPEHLKEPEYFAMKIIELYPNLFENYTGIKFIDSKIDSYEFLVEYAKKNNLLIKGGEPDLQRAGRKLLYEWQRGKIRD